LERWNKEKKDRKTAKEHILVKIEQPFLNIFGELCTLYRKNEQHGS
jgi:hypothetical protein